MKINLQIERLILDGALIERGHAPLVQAAVEAELARLLTAEGLAPSLVNSGSAPYAPSSTIQLTTRSNPVHLGTQIAQAVYGGLGK